MCFPVPVGPREQGAQCWVCFLDHSASIAASLRLRSHARAPNCTYSTTHVLLCCTQVQRRCPLHTQQQGVNVITQASSHALNAICNFRCSVLLLQQAAAAMHAGSTQQLASLTAAAFDVRLWLPAWSCMPPAADRLGFVTVIPTPGWPRAPSIVKPLTSPAAAAVCVLTACPPLQPCCSQPRRGHQRPEGPQGALEGHGRRQ